MSTGFEFPYEGRDKFVYASFCGNDAGKIQPLLEEMSRKGYRIWGDVQKNPDFSNVENIAQHLDSSSAFIAFVSAESINTFDCSREINFALMKNKSFIVVYLEEVKLSVGLEMQFAGRTALRMYDFANISDFIKGLEATGILSECVEAVEKTEAPEVKICGVCGSENMPNFKFCTKCGNNLLSEKAPEVNEEEERIKAEEEERIKAEEEARLRAEEEARIKAEEEARLRAEEEARLRAEEEARLKAEEEARLRAEEEARLKAEEEARLKAEEEARLRAEEEARLKAEEEARIKAEEEARLRAEEEARIKAEEEARLRAEEEAKNCVCPLCGYAVGKDDKFCEKCGGNLKGADLNPPAPVHIPATEEKQICSSCHEEVPAGYNFCTKCGGKPVAVSAVAAPAAEAVAEIPAETPAEKQICSSCHEEVPAGYNFCTKCGGKPVAVSAVAVPVAEIPAETPAEKQICSSCHEEVPAGYNFCTKCGGKPVAVSAVAVPAAEAVAEAPSGNNVLLCSVCGAQIAQGYKFCVKCGTEAPSAENSTAKFTNDKGSEYNPTSRYCIERKRNGVLADIKPGVFVIGRSEAQADFVIADNSTIGRKHAFISLQTDGCFIVDNSSLNKTFLNGSVLEPNVSYRIKDGDIIMLSDEEFIFREIKR